MMALPPIVDVSWLKKNLGSVKLCDVRTIDDFSESHLPGAVLAELDVVAAAPPGPLVGRHPLPTPQAFAEALATLGIGIEDSVVAYDDQGGLYAGRLVWMLRIIGCDAALLDGGYGAWDGELDSGPVEPRRTERKPIQWPSDYLVEADDVVGAIASGVTVFDARAGERYRGETEHLDPRAGHIPGALNLPCAQNLDASGRFSDIGELGAAYSEMGVTSDSIFYCGSGVTACHDLLVAEAAGIGKARLYVGSWSGWSSDPQRPGAFGPAMQEPSFVELFNRYAQTQGDKTAITLAGETLSYRELNERADNLAYHLLQMKVEPRAYVTIAEPNSLEYFVAFVACWKIGATPQPISGRLPPMELDAIVELADSPVVIGIEHHTRPYLARGFVAPARPKDFELPVVDPSPAWKAPTSGGSTGRPKLIVSGDRAVYTQSLAGLGAVIGAGPHETMVMPGPLYHNGPLVWSWLQLLSGGHLVVLPRFDAEATLAAVQDHSAGSIYVVPTMMQRIWKLHDDTKNSYDLSSLRTLFHLAEPCPQWLKQEWIDWLGADAIWELYGGTEGQCFTVLDGNDWLTHRGSVGKPISGELKIMDEDGNELAVGETGLVWMRRTNRPTPTYFYVGAEPEERDGWECLGDMGWIDNDGFLYLADRRGDMILVGGSNVFPAEVEAALSAHPKVRSSAVIGLPDEEKGNRIHAIIDGEDLTDDELLEFLAERLVSYKIPRSFEYVSQPLRDEAGKVRRAALVAERTTG